MRFFYPMRVSFGGIKAAHTAFFPSQPCLLKSNRVSVFFKIEYPYLKKKKGHEKKSEGSILLVSFNPFAANLLVSVPSVLFLKQPYLLGPFLTQAY